MSIRCALNRVDCTVQSAVGSLCDEVGSFDVLPVRVMSFSFVLLSQAEDPAVKTSGKEDNSFRNHIR